MNHYMREFVNATAELLCSEQVRMMGRWKHHGPVTTLDHSLFVAYLSFRAARALGLRADRFETCAGAVIDYYKSGIYFSSDEMQMIALFRRADAAVRERLLALLAAL